MIFNLFRKRVYLDFAATTPVSVRAQRAYQDAARVFGNPSSPHAEGRAAHSILEDARVRIARLAEVKPDAVIFTGNATEANALAIEGRIRALNAAGTAYADMHVLYLPGSHSSVTRAVARVALKGVAVEELVIKGGVLDLGCLRTQMRPTTVLVVVDAVCGETGMRYAVRDVRRVLDAGHSPATLHVDASQLPMSAPFELTRLGADTLSLDAQKVGGVRGIGALIAPRTTALAALYEGGGQERGLRPGTESHALASAFATALEEAHEERREFRVRAERMRSMLRASLAGVKDMYVNEGKDQDPRILNISLIGRDTDYLVALLDEAGFAVSTKSACETNEEGSRAVRALTGDEARAVSTLRISWGTQTPESVIPGFVHALLSSVEFLDTAGIL